MKKAKLLIAGILALLGTDSQSMEQNGSEEDIKYKIDAKNVSKSEFEALKKQLNISEDCSNSDSINEDGSFAGWEMNCSAKHKQSKKAYSYSEYGFAGIAYATHVITETK